jgi:rsbT antagonist protein RsbS
VIFVSILRQGDFLLASIHAALNDAEFIHFQEDVIEQIGTRRARGVIIDIAALDVLDSFGSSALRDLAHMARLRGAATVLVGIQPDVAFAIIKLGMTLDIHTALDLEEGLALLEALTGGSRLGRSTLDML